MSNLNTLLGIVGEVPLGDRWTARRLEEFPGEAYSVWWENRGIDGHWGVVAWQVPKATAEMLIALRAAVDGREITTVGKGFTLAEQIVSANSEV